MHIPTTGYQASNYWVDVDYSNGADITPPTVIFNTPATDATNININTSISVTFSENIDPTTVNASSTIFKGWLGKYNIRISQLFSGHKISHYTFIISS